MSDTYYRERAQRRTRKWLVLVVAVVIALLSLLGLRSLLYDSCTGGYDRSPDDVVRTYIAAIGDADAATAQACWEHQSFYDLGAGCSEICLSRAYGAQFEVLAVEIGQPYLSENARTRRLAKVEVSCMDTGEVQRGEILLDTVGANVFWKHWQIVESSFGGTVAQTWCK